MKNILFAVVFAWTVACASGGAQDLTFVIHDSTGQAADTPLPSTYIYADTTVGATSDLVVRAYNNTANTVEVAEIFFAATQDFTVTGTYSGKILSPGGTNFEEFTVHFKPSGTGPLVATLQAGYLVQKNGCDLTSSTPVTQCPATITNVTSFQGNGIAPALVVSYTTGSINTILRSTDTISFGNVSLSASASVMVTLQNQASVPVSTPAVSVQNQVFASSAFTSTVSALPVSIAPNSTVTFTVTFAPGQTGLTSAILQVGSNSYTLSGIGIVLADIDALQFSCVDQTGVRTLPQSATPISFGQVTVASGGSATLTCTVANPVTSFNAVTVQSIAATGSAFALTGLAAMPVSIAPGQSTTFQIVFTPAQAGASGGTLSIDARHYLLSGIGANLPLPDISLTFDSNTFTSQLQPHITVQLASNSAIDAVGTLTIAFTPSVTGASDDPAVMFLATSGRTLQINIKSGTQVGTYNGQSAFTFQTGSTAGTISFTLSFANKAPITQSITILPGPVVITASSAARQSPNLVITISGYDNTYSTGQLSFKFYDTKGTLITPSGIPVDATSAFHQYFFTNNTAGGTFSLQASFPVTGDVTQVGAVDVTLNNSSGTPATSHLNFQ